MKGMRIVLLVAMVLLLAAASAAAAPAASIPIEPNTLEEEPNNDFDTANRTYWEEAHHGTIGTVGDVDFYSFYVERSGSYVIDFYQPVSSPLNAVLGLYDEEGGLLTESPCADNGPCLYFTGETYADTFLKVSDAAGAGGPAYQYRATVRRIEEPDRYEPNDFLSEAKFILYDETIEALFEPCGDVDYYTFNGQAGDIIRINKSWWYAVDLTDADGNLVSASDVDEINLETTLPATGSYYLFFHDSSVCGNAWYDFKVDKLDQPLYVSFSTAGTIRGIPFTSGDVLRYWMNTGMWELYIDMSDLGLNGNLTVLGESYNWYDDVKSFLFGFAARYSQPDLGVVQPQDLVRFHPDSLGRDTSGRMSVWLDGSDVGLTTANERIDAVSLDDWYDGPWVSTAGQAHIPYGAFGLAQATFRDEDIISNDGEWYGRFDGSVHGLSAADVVGIDVGGNLMLSFDRTVKLSGITFAPGDIAECHDGGRWWTEPCAYFTRFFDASDAGIGSYRIDAFEVGEAE